MLSLGDFVESGRVTGGAVCVAGRPPDRAAGHAREVYLACSDDADGQVTEFRQVIRKGNEDER